jgi:glucose/arabinose dehydrogenase
VRQIIGKATLVAVSAASGLLQVVAHADQAGEAIYFERCAACHGRDLRGGNAQSMVDGVWQFGGEGANFRNVKFGISAVGMPDYQHVLSDDQINQVLSYVNGVAKSAGIERPPLPEQLSTRDYDVRVATWIADGLEVPWSLVFADAQTAWVTERPGRLRAIREGVPAEPVAGLPPMLAEGQGGLMDVALDPNYAENGWIYLCYSHASLRRNDRGDRAAMTRVIRGRVRDNAWCDEQTLFEADDASYRFTRHHFGARLAFDREGLLYFAIGDRGQDPEAQDLSLPNGKIHRIMADGGIPSDNPFVGVAGALPTIFSYGHRNPQGLAVHPDTGALWESEHGPMGGDEINIVKPGVNYGWPEICYGINYNGEPVTDKIAAEGMEQPIVYWAPSIAVCGIDFYQGQEFPRWQGNLLVTGLGYEELRRLVVAGDRVMHQELLLKHAGRVRDVTCGPDGAIYVVLNGPDKILRLTAIGPALRQ